ncbi:GMC family oxidoreductase [Promicromonospora sukumoe]|uniref:Cholesterol oxidase n=1 Tax=Promicromonospora sukumoe TaxID=88382 RepID=A0A7W3JD33_9MICO|nr:GMC family oxidoreductase [Promicromonospora sukumoe]MBA8810621.1 cholesterol oxidase [Promicromonospora sukumoe]
MDYDVLVIGSGFGGSVAALRLTEKGYRVGVLEAGRRFADDEFAKNSWHLRQFLWAPALGCYGIQRVRLLRNVLCLTGAGVGGGSLVYANTLYRPLDPFYADPAWSHIADWKSELAPYYDQAERMLGVVRYHGRSPADDVIRSVADDMGVGDTFRPTRVGVYFGPGGAEAPTPGRTDADPFFGGAGPERTGCVECGECMTGCRHGAKNTLVKNYLYLAERAGAVVHPLTTADVVRPLPDARGGGYEIRAHRTGRRWAGRRTFTARQVVFAAGTLGTQRLLHAMKDAGTLPGLSGRLGHLTRTNSEALLGAMTHKVGSTDYSRGLAITSSFYPNESTHIEPVRYGHGSNVMAALQHILVDGGPRRFLRWFGEMRKNLRWLPVLMDWRRWSERTVIALVMQAHDNSLTTLTRRSPFGRYMTSRQGTGAPNPSWIPEGHEAVRRMADTMGDDGVEGIAGGTIGDPFNIPLTAHILGGCAIGSDAGNGVVDPYLRMYGHEGLHVMDGSAVTANLGVNPSLTITAQAERACALWPNAGEQDARPALGSAYRRVGAVRPVAPVVPEAAPAALRLPIVGIS